MDLISSSVFGSPHKGGCSTLSVKLISDWAGGGRMSDICALWVGVGVFGKKKPEGSAALQRVDRQR